MTMPAPRRFVRVFAVAWLGAVLATLGVPPAGARAGRTAEAASHGGGAASVRRGPAPYLRVARPVGGHGAGVRSTAGRDFLSRGYLVPHPEAYARAKAALRGDRSAASAATASGSPPLAIRGFNGTFDPRTTPPDPTGAVGPTRYVQLVNTKFAIYRRDGSRLSGGDMGVLTGMGRNFPFLTDPQIIWDPGSARFYYVVLDFDVVGRDPSDGVDFAFGFSKTASPSDAGDWCKYTVSLGYDDPETGRKRLGDQPHLGDTAGAVLWGANIFSVRFAERFVGADVDWVKKPPGGRRCPKAGALSVGAQRDLRTASGARAFTPVVANQVDGSHTGWVVAARQLPRAATRARSVSVFKVTDAPGGPVVQRRARVVSVPPYGFPPSAPQDGTRFTLDTLDGRLTQAVTAVDPSRHRAAVWTQHAVRGGAGSKIRWYEIDPAHRRVLRSGVVSDPALWAFNGAISPDRVVRPGTRKFGQSMVLGFNTSSHATDAAIQMVSKVPGEPQSSFVLLRSSAGPEVDFSCRDTGTCRWGDFSGASPDPAASVTKPRGRVWLTNMRNTRNGPGVDWRTFIWDARP
jgi:hypothetical protein